MHIPDNTKGLLFGIYRRRSSDDSDHQMASLPAQRSELTQLWQENGLKVVKEYEESHSAKRPGRPIFNQMTYDIEKGLINGLIVWDISRLSRNPVDAGKILWYLQQKKILAIITPFHIYLPEDNVLLHFLEFGQANQNIRDLSEGVKRGFRDRIKAGYRPSQAPEGYLNDNSKGKGLSEIIPDPLRFSLIRKMWDLLLTGAYSVPQILKIVNEDWKYTTRKRKKLGGKKLSRSGLYRIFTNTFYFGDYTFNGQIHAGIHTPMITETEYHKAQAILGKKGKQCPKTRIFTFTGLIRCGECGAMITAEEKTNRFGSKYIYYHCTKRKNPKCTQGSIDVQTLMNQIDDILASIQIPEEFKDWAIDYLYELKDQDKHDQKLIVQNNSDTLIDCQKKIDNLVKLKISPENTNGEYISNEDYKRQMDSLQKEKRELSGTKVDPIKAQEDGDKLSKETFEFATYARYWMKHHPREKQRELFCKLGSNPILRDKTLRLDAKNEFIIMKKCKRVLDDIYSTLEPLPNVDRRLQLYSLFNQNPALRR